MNELILIVLATNLGTYLAKTFTQRPIALFNYLKHGIFRSLSELLKRVYSICLLYKETY